MFMFTFIISKASQSRQTQAVNEDVSKIQHNMDIRCSVQLFDLSWQLVNLSLLFLYLLDCRCCSAGSEGLHLTPSHLSSRYVNTADCHRCCE